MEFLIFRPEPWHWLTLGFLLMAVEIMVPGVLFLWFGLAGVATGLTLLVVDMPIGYQLLTYGVFAVLSYIPVRYYVRRYQDGDQHAAEGLNERGRALIGERVTVTDAVVNGHGAAKVGDSRWRIACDEDLEVGAAAEVVEVIGTTLTVRRVGSKP